MTPYRQLGERLKRIRQDARESMAEASGAVEIDLKTFESYERGESRPTEDVLHLLISHFDLDDSAADGLWSLAGYDKKTGGDDQNLSQQAVVVLPMDSRIVYTDMVSITVNNYGVVMNFLQQGAQNNSNGTPQPMAVARVGMSLEHARSVIDVLRHSLEQASKNQSKRLLPGPKSQQEQEKDQQ